jgi:hypothetical protein
MDLEKKLIHLEPDKFFHWAMKKWKYLIPSHYINSDSHYWHLSANRLDKKTMHQVVYSYSTSTINQQGHVQWLI